MKDRNWIIDISCASWEAFEKDRLLLKFRKMIVVYSTSDVDTLSSGIAVLYPSVSGATQGMFNPTMLLSEMGFPSFEYFWIEQKSILLSHSLWVGRGGSFDHGNVDWLQHSCKRNSRHSWVLTDHIWHLGCTFKSLQRLQFLSILYSCRSGYL